MSWLPKSLFSKLQLIIMFFMICCYITLRILFVELLSHPIAHHFAYFSESLALFADEIHDYKTLESQKLFSKRLQERTGMILVWNVDQTWGAPPALPFFNEWTKTMNVTWNDDLILRYQDEPQPILWLLHTKSPSFSLGIPDFNTFNLKLYGILGLFLELIFAVFAAFYSAKYLKNPLKKLVEGVELIAHDIHSEDIRINGPTEICDIAVALNTMKNDINDMIREQESLLAELSHDIRTPLTRLCLATKMLKSDSIIQVKGINEDIEEINIALDQFIDLMRFNIEYGEPWEVGDITELLNDVTEKYKRANIDLNLILKKIPFIRYKPMYLKRFLYNSIDNGIEHGGGKITVVAKSIDGFLELSVKDEGLGFKQSSANLTVYANLDVNQGCSEGLGLGILQRIAKIHEGKLKLCNRPKGGAKVMLSLKAY